MNSSTTPAPEAWALDLDGVVWLADQPVPGSAAAVHRLVASGRKVALVTNNSNATVAAYRAKLASHGLPEVDLVTSAMAAATMLHPGERVLVCAGPGVTEAVAAAGAEPVANNGTSVDADAVVVGFHRDFDFDRLAAAARAVRRGARLIGTNDDATYPTPEGPIPGGGAILAAVQTASGRQAEVAGKPHEPIAALVRRRLGASGVMVGDRPETDGAFARTLGFRFGLVLTGVTSAEGAASLADRPDVVAPDLAAVVEDLLAAGSGGLGRQ